MTERPEAAKRRFVTETLQEPPLAMPYFGIQASGQPGTAYHGGTFKWKTLLRLPIHLTYDLAKLETNINLSSTCRGKSLRKRRNSKAKFVDDGAGPSLVQEQLVKEVGSSWYRQAPLDR